MTNPQPIETTSSASSRGGPRTDEGKSQSSRNALTHGLTATTLLPSLLNAELLAHKVQSLSAEWRPRTPTEKILVAEMARHSCLLEFVEKAEPSVLRNGARGLVQLQSPALDAEETSAECHDVVLASAMSNAALDALTRYRRAHEKGLHQALQRLRDLRARPKTEMDRRRVEPPFAFTQGECERFLGARFQAASWRCPQCGDARGSWIASRGRWQCLGCKRQIGLRAGTIMEGSRVAIAVWFRLTWAILNRSDVSLAELTAVTKLTRAATVSCLAERVRAALSSPEASRLVAGLDRVYLAQMNQGDLN